MGHLGALNCGSNLWKTLEGAQRGNTEHKNEPRTNNREKNPQSSLPGGNIFTSNISANVPGLTDLPETPILTSIGENKDGNRAKEKKYLYLKGLQIGGLF